MGAVLPKKFLVLNHNDSFDRHGGYEERPP
jgi:hypothetical protein